MLLNNSDRARQALAVFWCVILLAGVSIIFSGVHLAFLDSPDLNSMIDLAASILTLLQLVVLVLSAVYFIRWFRRAYANLERVGFSIEHEDKWAAGAWFVPYMNLRRPYTIMREIWRNTQLLSHDTVQPHGLLRWWWAAFLIRSIVANISSRITAHPETLLQLQNAIIANLIDCAFTIISAILSIMVIKRVSDFEQQLALYQEVEKIGRPAPEAVNIGATEEELYY